MIDVKAMREIVEAATPGEWMLGDENNSSAEVMLGAKHNLVVSLDRYDKNTGEQVISREQMLANARHIITFNPESVTALLNALEAAQARIKELERDRAEEKLSLAREVPMRAIKVILDRFKDDAFNAYMRKAEIDSVVKFLTTITKIVAIKPQPPEQESEL